MDQIPQQRHNLSGRALRDTRRYCFCQLPKTFYQRHGSDLGHRGFAVVPSEPT
nr:hypothetical protein [uncultured Pseudomonas sp.]